jgi:lysophospholipase L1-like esterase
VIVRGWSLLVAVLCSVVLLAAGSVAVADPLVPPPGSMAATGDSFSRGFATGTAPCTTFVECPQFSWSTGASVTSHYERLVALNPALAGHAINAAVPGAGMSSFATQVGTFAASKPDYVTALFGGSEICFGPTTPALFASRFRAGMDALFAASPNTRVLVSSLWNFESIRAAVLAGNPSATWSFCGAFFNASAPARATLMAQVVAYNAALQTECATYANCRFDGNALFDHVWTAAEVSPVDNLHPSVAGQQMIADVLYAAGYHWGYEPPAAPAAAPVETVVRFTG